MSVNNSGKVYLVPAPLSEGGTNVIPSYVLDCIKDCQVFFVEDERTARRYLKSIWREMVIDDYTWFTIGKAEQEVRQQFKQTLKDGKNVAIISEAGCPGIADPGQLLVDFAHELGAPVKPLVGPSSILLALMASGFNGQRFQFDGYLPIDSEKRKLMIRQLENDSRKNNCTHLFIETPYRNNQLLEALLSNLSDNTKLSVAASLTSKEEFIKSARVGAWKKTKVDLHKKPAIFSIYVPG
jgi:16S rRNA (cytidine1402-2'-O)-methyltransferase